MQKNRQDLNNKDNKSSDYVKYTGIAFQMLGIIALFAFIGYEIDVHLKNQTQWVTALCCLVGVCLSIFQTIRQLSK